MRKYKISHIFLAVLIASLIIAPGFKMIGELLFTDELNKGRPAKFQWTVMGTVAGLSFKEGSPVQDLIRVDAQNIYSTFEKKLSAWKKDSDICKICEQAGLGVPVKISDDVAWVYEEAFRVAKESGGAFNPLIGNVMKLWGFNGGEIPNEVLSEEEIATVPFSLNDVVWTNGTMRLAKKGMTIDLGAIAKGAAVDAVYDEIRRKYQGEKLDLLIDLGGNLRVVGEKTWKTGVRNPFRDGLIGVVVLKNGEAIATSGNYERFVMIGGKRYAHILDGRTGRPVHGVAAVTVIAPTATLADALSTTLFILGPDEGLAFLNKHYPDVDALWIPDDPQSKKIIYSKRMKTRFGIIPNK